MKNLYETHGEITYIYCSHKGNIVKVPIETKDLEKVDSMPNTWRVSADGRGRAYCESQIKIGDKRVKVKMHRWITDCPKGLEVDHINHDSLDNRSSNLRVVDRSTNMRNVRPRSTSGILGVHRDKYGRWEAKITVDYVHKYLGTFETKEEAAEILRIFKTIWGLK